VQEGSTSKILDHPFFAALDLNQLKNGTLAPEFIPEPQVGRPVIKPACVYVAAAPINSFDFRPSLLIDLVSLSLVGVPRAHLHAQARQSVLGRPEAIQGLLNGDSRTRRVKTTTHVAWEVGNHHKE